MASHWPFGHLQPKLWAKEGPGVKLAVWLPTTKSRESTSSRPPNWKCDTLLKRSQRGLQVWFRPRRNQTSQSGVMSSQSPGTPPGTISGQFWDNFGTPTRESRESREKVTFGRGCRGVSQSILYGVRWWLTPESGPWWVKWVQLPVACPNTQGCPEC
jgi:hypothetical protein